MSDVFSNDDGPMTRSSERAAKRAIAKARKEDPLIGAKSGGKALVDYLTDDLKDDRGVHVESLLGAIGALAGFSCQMALWAENITPNDDDIGLGFLEMDTVDGEKFYFGDLINEPLLENDNSIWQLVVDGARFNGCSELPDIAEIVEHVASTIGFDGFGVPRVPERHAPKKSSADYIRDLWPRIKPLLQKYCVDPSEWPILLGHAALETIVMSRIAIDTQTAVKIIMESAISSAKRDPVALGISV